MKPWNTRVAWLASAGLYLGLAACRWSTAAEPPPEARPEAPAAAPGADAPAVGDREEESLEFLKAANANRGVRKHYLTPITAAQTFLAALKQKDLKKIAEATALHAATESKNQELFRSILAQKLGQDDLDELARQLSGFQITATAAPAGGLIKVVVTRPDGNGVLRRNLTMRQEKAGWKVQDISGEGLLAQPIMMPRTGRGGKPK
jgi:hypothetical protein